MGEFHLSLAIYLLLRKDGQRSRMNKSVVTLLLLFSWSFADAQKQVDGNGKERSAKLFFVSSSSTTSTLSTTTLCFTTDANAAALVTCTKKRRRSIVDTNKQTSEQINSTPMRRQNDEKESNELQLDSGVRENSLDREGRFLLYWLTTTSTSTSTTYTATTTLSNLNCTPNGFTISLCG